MSKDITLGTHHNMAVNSLCWLQKASKRGQKRIKKNFNH
jgi:hypothetical protein